MKKMIVLFTLFFSVINPQQAKAQSMVEYQLLQQLIASIAQAYACILIPEVQDSVLETRLHKADINGERIETLLTEMSGWRSLCKAGRAEAVKPSSDLMPELGCAYLQSLPNSTLQEQGVDGTISWLNQQRAYLEACAMPMDLGGQTG